MIVLTLPFPVSANAYWRTTARGGRAITYVSAEAKEYKHQVAHLAKAAGVCKPITGRVQIGITLYPRRPQDWQTRMRKHGVAWDDTVQCLDLDNAQKVLLDSLKGIAFGDDKWVRKIDAERAEPDAQGARVVVTVTPLQVETPQLGLITEEATC
ncbi:MAG TPA: RusA family crossover junction endodeoxyribonuclease [Burkholderiaceae bacterium]|nr:RusA family crossover junction endodeoxyribonuclease [Burkholderiaceae bacterium]